MQVSWSVIFHFAEGTDGLAATRVLHQTSSWLADRNGRLALQNDHGAPTTAFLPDRGSAEALVSYLRTIGVESAYIKPPDALP